MTPGCTGSWVYTPGMTLSPADPDATEPPVDRQCDDCRVKVGAPERDPRRVDTEAAPDGADEAAEAEAAEVEAAEVESEPASEVEAPDGD